MAAADRGTWRLAGPLVAACLGPIVALASPPAAFGTEPFGKLVDDAWAAIDNRFYDDTFGGLDWAAMRRELAARQVRSTAEAYAAIREMLERLGDPATRFLTSSQAEALADEFSAEASAGIGLFEVLSIDVDERSGAIVIVTPVPGWPAARAGLLPGDDVQVLNAEGDQRVTQPVVVLANHGSASAAEVLAGAFQDRQRAAVVGERTFGKGLVHGLEPLSDDSAVILTLGRLETLSGRDLLTQGIEPDVKATAPTSPVIDARVEVASSSDLVYRRALDLLVERIAKGR
jgi:C-terminal processing protease CtpA/Prc